MIRRHMAALRFILMLADGVAAALVLLLVSLVRFGDGDVRTGIADVLPGPIDPRSLSKLAAGLVATGVGGCIGIGWRRGSFADAARSLIEQRAIGKCCSHDRASRNAKEHADSHSLVGLWVF